MRGVSTLVGKAVGRAVGRAVYRAGRRAGRLRTRGRFLGAARTAARGWGWPVLPGVGAAPGGGCRCPRPDCQVPGAHPHEPKLLAATTDDRMIRWWWSRRPEAPVLVATGGQVCALSLPAEAGARVLDYFDALRVPIGPVIATPTRYVLLVAPYSFPELGELLVAQEWVPTSLRYHGPGGYVVLPPSRTGAGAMRWVRRPLSTREQPWLPSVSDLVEALVAASVAAPDGATLAP
ncbi:hypothetical protein ABH940_000183 [Streptacidiphilus sp. BW17]|jgi:hypothetical protein|uniref:bifunctional DNA primase/polymerase n=1 Tax=Streptacidiphilus sp. BW17 TaxID=3156274 RepID=UPI00351277EE